MDYVTQYDDDLLIHLHKHGPTVVRGYAELRVARRLQHRGKVKLYSRDGRRIVALRGSSRA